MSMDAASLSFPTMPWGMHLQNDSTTLGSEDCLAISYPLPPLWLYLVGSWLMWIIQNMQETSESSYSQMHRAELGGAPEWGLSGLDLIRGHHGAVSSSRDMSQLRKNSPG